MFFCFVQSETSLALDALLHSGLKSTLRRLDTDNNILGVFLLSTSRRYILDGRKWEGERRSRLYRNKTGSRIRYSQKVAQCLSIGCNVICFFEKNYISSQFFIFRMRMTEKKISKMFRIARKNNNSAECSNVQTQCKFPVCVSTSQIIIERCHSHYIRYHIAVGRKSSWTRQTFSVDKSQSLKLTSHTDFFSFLCQNIYVQNEFPFCT